MVAYKIIWTEKANRDRQNILNFWIQHNKSKIYSLKLHKLLISTIQEIAKRPDIGRLSEFENVRVKIVRQYLIFYSIKKR